MYVISSNEGALRNFQTALTWINVIFKYLLRNIMFRNLNWSGPEMVNKICKSESSALFSILFSVCSVQNNTINPLLRKAK